MYGNTLNWFQAYGKTTPTPASNTQNMQKNLCCDDSRAIKNSQGNIPQQIGTPKVMGAICGAQLVPKRIPDTWKHHPPTPASNTSKKYTRKPGILIKKGFHKTSQRTHIYVNIWRYTYIYVYVYICIHTLISICIYAYTHIYVHKNIHIHIYVY